MKFRKYLTKLSNLFRYHEELCRQRKADTPESIATMNLIKRLFEDKGYEFCAHNAAIVGSMRYKKYKYEGIDRLITKKEYEKMLEKENNRDCEDVK